MFDEAQCWIFELMKNDIFRRFKKSAVWINYLEEKEVEEISNKIKSEEEELEKQRQMEKQKELLKLLERGKELNMRNTSDYSPTLTKWNGTDPRPCEISQKLLEDILSIYRSHKDDLNSMAIKMDTESEDQIADTNMNGFSFIELDPKYTKFCRFTTQLQEMNLENLNDKEKLVFFVNIFNTMCLHGLVEYGPQAVMFEKYNFFKKVIYRIGIHSYSMLEIEHSILRIHATRPYFLGLKFSKYYRFPKQDPRCNYCLSQGESLVNFVLYHGTKSSPPVDVYTCADYKQKMIANAKEYTAREVELSGFDSYDLKGKFIVLPKEFSYYNRDFSANGSETEMIASLVPLLPDTIRDKIKFFISSGNLKIKYKVSRWQFGGYMGRK